jgi:hypothetical protein
MDALSLPSSPVGLTWRTSIPVPAENTKKGQSINERNSHMQLG